MNRTGEVSTFRRSWEIARTGSKYFIFHKINRHRHETLGVRLRLACEELGLVFIKLGQVLSARYDLLSAENCKELRQLLDSVPPFALAETRKIFREDFGREPEECFADFELDLVASASIAQVYAARLPDGSKLAVKVKRPGVERHVRADMKILRTFARVLCVVSKKLRHVDIPRIVNELEYWILLETDFENEIRNIKCASSFYHGEGRTVAGSYSDLLVFPKVHEELSSGRVITMDFIEGVPVKDVESIRNNPDYDIRQSIQGLLGTVMRVWMEADIMYYHGDPHPSNILIRPGGELGLLDFGILGHFERKDLEDTRDLMLAVYTENVEEAIRLGLQMADISYTEILAAELRADIAEYIRKTKYEGMGFWFMEFIRIYMKHQLPLPYQLVLFGRMNFLLDGLAVMALPGTPAMDLLEGELKRAVRRRTLRNFTKLNFVPAMYVLSEKIRKSPHLVADLIDRYFDDPLEALRNFKEIVRAL